jgi:mitosis inhibitor protein kinase SWE1
MGRYDKPADIFALGLIMLETAGNVELPDNGVSWQKLRNGDMSDVPSLTWNSADSSIARDASGNPISYNEVAEVDVDIMDSDHEHGSTQHGKSPTLLARNGELIVPPPFMVDATNEDALDQIVRWMISPDPSDRPLATDIVIAEGVRFVQARRRAGATIYEGNWGPADSVLAEDAEMLDV